MKNFFKQNKNTLIYIIPLGLILVYLFWKSLTFPLHDFSNSYFPAHIATNDNKPEETLFDIYAFNKYIWDLGYDEVLADFYLNSPFNATFFYPFAKLEDAYLAKSIYTIISCVLFLLAIFYLARRYGRKSKWLVVAIPIICYAPLRNQVLFGQTYFLVFALVVLSYILFEKHKKISGSSLLAIAALLKVFPVAYGFPLLFKKEWKTVIIIIFIGITLLSLSLLVSGTSIWEAYIFDVIPNAIKNKSTVNFQYNAQSMDVFLKTLFIKDTYYNPDAIFNNARWYYALKWIFKSVVVGIAISLSFSHKDKLFKVLSIWVVTLFLIQSRTATYAQILWIIPAFYMISSTLPLIRKVLFLGVLFLVCNLPISSLEALPLFFKFSRLWLSLILALLFYTSFKKKINYKYITLGFLLLLPLHRDMFFTPEKHASTYVLDHKNHFMIYDFNVENNMLVYSAIGKNGDEVVNAEIAITSFDVVACKVENNQIVMKRKQITNTPALKKKPVLVNGCEVYYLTDSNSRRGAFTIKKLNICNNNK
ncbi:glycosyltransferase family 87 protein [Winogradskyella flava]|uniref:DUF2029 domain-containing protein n=1 Tax=Winogradskyella flava TaxID=1884876 RepID=A0A842IQ52_9FLAO|nr:glycosyltransferase family 87 protein [Winogradskyella flava]MBC2843627.1 DUF2029 domain-containing protein [Winogradskyella flava]